MKAKRFLVFSYEQYYPNGGWGDFSKTFDTLEECTEHIKNCCGDFFDIIDLENIKEK